MKILSVFAWTLLCSVAAGAVAGAGEGTGSLGDRTPAATPAGWGDAGVVHLAQTEQSGSITTRPGGGGGGTSKLGSREQATVREPPKEASSAAQSSSPAPPAEEAPATAEGSGDQLSAQPVSDDEGDSQAQEEEVVASDGSAGEEILEELTSDTDRLQPGDLTYLGAFDIPKGFWKDPKSEQYAYSLGAIAYRAFDDSLYVTTHAHSPNHVGRFAVPDSFEGTPTAQELESAIRLPEHDPEERVRTRGLFYHEGTDLLFYTQHVWYNVSATDMQALAAIDPETGEHFGPWWVNGNNRTAGPIAYKDGKLYIGLAVSQGVSGSNQGPAAYELDPFDLPPADTNLPYVTLLEHPYTGGKRTRAELMSNGAPWITGMVYWGAAIVEETALYFVEEGERSFYGTGKGFEAKFGFEPRSSSKGYHHDVYRPVVYFYDMADLERVREGELEPWEPRPYAYHRLAELPDGAYLGGATVDYSNRRLFVAQRRTSRAVRVHVYGW